jgi:uncharacterized membrane protein
MNVRAVLTASGAMIALGLFATRRRHRDGTASRAHAARSVTVRAEPSALFALFRDPQTFTRIFPMLDSVEAVDVDRQRWTAKIKKRRVPIDVRIVDEVVPERFEWQIASAGYSAGGSFTLRAAPGDRGTEAHLALYADGPAAKTASAIARPFGMSLAQLAMESLRRLKALAETGEIPRAAVA